MSEKEKEVETIEPRINMAEIPQDKFDTHAGIDDMLHVDRKQIGRPIYLDKVIDDSYNAPGFVERGDGRVNPVAPSEEPPPEPRNAAEAAAKDPLMKRYDCTHGCGKHQTVQPVNQSGKDWQCSYCGKNYQMT